MQIILLEDVKALGKKGAIVKVSDGYARNMILPKKLGLEATPGNLASWKMQKKREEKDAAEHLATAQEFKQEVEEKIITLTMKKGEGDRVFGSVSTKEIAQAAKEQHGFDIDKKKLVLPEPIKSFGTHEVPLKLHPQVTATLRVKVIEQ